MAINDSGLKPVPMTAVALRGGFWEARQRRIREVTLPAQYDWCRQTGRIDAWRLKWKPGQQHKPHIFWDSDIGKWIEAAAYSLMLRPDPALRRRVERLVDLIARAQRRDGYLNTYFTVVEPGRRWTNLRGAHELYCAGHLIEAATAYHQATGDSRLLRVLCRYADHIDLTFGRRRGQKRGYCGHPEIELALVKLYRATGEERYLRLAEYFVNERGRLPHYFAREPGAPGEEVPVTSAIYQYTQSHRPVREQRDAVGHAVRAMYLYAGMADVARETGDRTLAAACRRLWDSVTQRRMYVTGGIGSTRQGEAFTFDYDLPNETAYAETCAAVGLVFFAHRMLQLEADARYADVMERALYNGVLSGISLDGQRFFYANPLAVIPSNAPFLQPPMAVERQPWFECACCPPNLARLVLSLGGYLCSTRRDTVYVHLYASGSVTTPAARITMETEYPWKETVRLTVSPSRPGRFTLALRIPGWCADAHFRVNGQRQNPRRRKGYALVTRRWTNGDGVELRLPMPVMRIESHPQVRMNAGCIALQRGPVVYCIEEADLGPQLHQIVIPDNARLSARFEPKLLGGVCVITGRARREVPDGWGSSLYRSDPPRAALQPVRLRAVPYFTWANRGRGEMRVWVRQG
jgi:DUF1680 family protein